MALPPIVLRFESSGAARVHSDIDTGTKKLREQADAARGVAAEAKKAADEASKLARAASGVDAKKARDHAQALRDDAKAASEAARNAELLARNAERLDSKRARDYEAALRTVESAQTRVNALTQQNLQLVRNMSVAVAAAGAAGLVMGKQWEKAYSDAANMEQRYKGLLEQQGRGGDFEQIKNVVADVTIKAHLSPAQANEAKGAVSQLLSDEVKTADVPGLLEASTRNAQQLGRSVEEVATSFSKAYAEGSLERLKRQNILFSDQEQAAVAAAYGISQAAGQTEFMRVVMAATNRDTAALGTTLTETQKKANDTAREFQDFSVAAGQGVQDVDNWVKDLPATMAEAISKNKEFAHTFGEIWEGASYAATGIGTLLASAAQAFIVYNSMKLLAQQNKAAQIELAQAQAAAAAAAGTNAEAQTVSGAASATAGEEAAAGSVGFDTLAAAEGASASAAVFEADAVATAGTASATAGAAASGGAALGAGGAVAGAGEGLLGAAAGAGTAALAGVGAVGVGAATALGYAAYKNGQAVGLFNRKQGFGDRLARGWGHLRDLVTRNPGNYERTHGGYADEDNAPSGASAPSANASSSDPGAMPPTSTATASNSPGLAEGDSSGLQSQIESLQDEIRHSKNKNHKAALRDQLVQLQRSLKLVKAAEADAKKAASALKRANDKSEREAVKVQKQENKDDLLVQKAQIENEREDQIADLQDQLDKARDAKNVAQVRALTQQIENIKAQQRYDEAMAAAAQEAPGQHRDALEKVAALNLQADQRRAERAGEKAATSSSQSGDAGDAGKRRDAMLRARLAMQQAAQNGGPGAFTYSVNGQAYSGNNDGWAPSFDGLGRAVNARNPGGSGSRSSTAGGPRTLKSSYAGKQGNALVFKIEDLHLPVDDIRMVAGALGNSDWGRGLG